MADKKTAAHDPNTGDKPPKEAPRGAPGRPAAAAPAAIEAPIAAPTVAAAEPGHELVDVRRELVATGLVAVLDKLREDATRVQAMGAALHTPHSLGDVIVAMGALRDAVALLGDVSQDVTTLLHALAIATDRGA